uniref:Venom carboxylesterase-6-like protein n=1 Tax=Rondotia menciana TaxID=1221527 RepID=A0A7L9QHS5_9NEOP|nr:venom carboxylesterase-6-like protein [Rondotia menciana]
MLRYCLLFIVLVHVIAEEDEDYKIVELDYGTVSGKKYWNGEYYEFFGVPYATVPKGKDRFKPALPVEPWEGVKEANILNSVCEQVYLTENPEDEVMLHGEEECLTINLLVPKIADEKNLVPVIVYIHSGAFAGGSGNMARYNYLARHDVIAINFNYRVGGLGFACLGTEDIPGNAGLRDQITALKWINKYIKKFGGDPNKVTLAGYSVGAAMAELLMLSKATDGLFHQLVLESGSVLAPFAINRHPITTARNIAVSIGFNDTGSLKELNDFLINAPILDLASKSKNFYLTNSTFGFAPCIETKVDGIEPVITQSPLDIIKSGDYKKIPIITGYSNMEGISRTIKFGEWRDKMNENFADFLPADLKFDSEKSRDDFIKEIRKHYFKSEDVTHESLQAYIDYFSDSMFKYSIMKSAKLHAQKSDKPVYLYEFTYVGKLNMKHHYMDRVKGASHRDQTAYVLDFFDHTSRYKDMDTRDRLTSMWTDFVKYSEPTAFESLLINVKWLEYDDKEHFFLEIGGKLKMKKDLFVKRYSFWDKVYQKFYWNPTTVGVDNSK